MHSKFNTTYSYMTMNVLFSQDSSYAVVKAEDVNKAVLMDLVEFFDFGFVGTALQAAAVRTSAPLEICIVADDDMEEEDLRDLNDSDNELIKLFRKEVQK